MRKNRKIFCRRDNKQKWIISQWWTSCHPSWVLAVASAHDPLCLLNKPETLLILTAQFTGAQHKTSLPPSASEPKLVTDSERWHVGGPMVSRWCARSRKCMSPHAHSRWGDMVTWDHVQPGKVCWIANRSYQRFNLNCRIVENLKFLVSIVNKKHQK